MRSNMRTLAIAEAVGTLPASGFHVQVMEWDTARHPDQLLARQEDNAYADFPSCSQSCLNAAFNSARCRDFVCLCKAVDQLDQVCLNEICGDGYITMVNARYENICKNPEDRSITSSSDTDIVTLTTTRRSTRVITIPTIPERESDSSTETKQSDIESPSPSETRRPTMTSPSGKAASTTGSTIPRPSNDNVGSQRNSEELAAGAKAGIGVGVSLGVLIMVLALLFLWRRRRGRLGERSETNAPTDPEIAELEQNGRHELDDTRKSGGYIGPKPVSGAVPAELKDQAIANELKRQNAPAELP